jgi:hypothetical protein
MGIRILRARLQEHVVVSASRALESATKRRPASNRRLLQNDEAGPFQALHKAPGDDRRHEFIGVVDALAPAEGLRKGERVGLAGHIVCYRQRIDIFLQKSKIDATMVPRVRNVREFPSSHKRSVYG